MNGKYDESIGNTFLVISCFTKSLKQIIESVNTFVNNSRSPSAAITKPAATKSSNKPTNTPLAVESNIEIATIMPLRLQKLQN